MIIKWEDEEGMSFFDYIVQFSITSDQKLITLTQATLDEKLVKRILSHGSIRVLTDKGAVLDRYELGPKPLTVIQPEEQHDHPHPH
jgi:hypothetical protein